MAERLLCTQEAIGSIPFTSTINSFITLNEYRLNFFICSLKIECEIKQLVIRIRRMF